LELVISDIVIVKPSVQYGSNVREGVQSIGVPSETTAGSDFWISVEAETLVSRCRGCSLGTHIPTQEAWSSHHPSPL